MRLEKINSVNLNGEHSFHIRIEICVFFFQIIVVKGVEADLKCYSIYSQFHSSGQIIFYSYERRLLECRWETTTSVLRVMTSQSQKNGA
jgi:hypothetical protein